MDKCNLSTNEEFISLKVRVNELQKEVKALWDKQDGTQAEIRSNKDKYLPAVDLINRTAQSLKDHEEESHNQFSHISSTLGSLTEINNALVKEVDLIGNKVRELDLSESKSIERDFHIAKDIKGLQEDIKKAQDAYFNQFREHDKKEMEKYDIIDKSIKDLIVAIDVEKDKNDKRYGKVLKVFWTVSGGIAVLAFFVAKIDLIKGLL